MEPTTTQTAIVKSPINSSIAGETALSESGAIAFKNVQEMMEFSKLLACAKVAIPAHLRDNPGACLAVTIQASEWRMSPYAVANKTYVVNDRLSYESQLVNAVILRRAPIQGRFGITYTGEGPTRKCKVTATLSENGQEVEYESPQFKDITIKNSPLWKNDPDQQLFYFSSRAMCRRHFPDVLLGIYTMDELDDQPRQQKMAKGSVLESPLNPFPDALEITAEKEDQP